MILFQQKRNSFVLRYSSNKFSFQPWVHANKKWHIKSQSHVKVNKKLSSNDFFFLFLIKECHWNYSKLHINDNDYVICLFLLIDCLYWQLLSLSIVLCLCLLERKSQAQRSYDWSYESCCTYFSSKNAMFITFLKQILRITYDLL